MPSLAHRGSCAFEGGRFQSEWFREWYAALDDMGVERYYLGDVRFDGAGNAVFKLDKSWPVARCWNVTVCDPACSEDDDSDHTVIVTAAITPERDIIILDVFREQLAIDKIVPAIRKVCQGYSPNWVGIEDVAFQVGILKEARKAAGIPAVMPLSPEGRGKLVRATPAIIRTEAGQVFIPHNRRKFKWVEGFVAELVMFTGNEDEDAADDQVDAFAYLVQAIDKHAGGSPELVTPDPMDPGEEESDDDEFRGTMFNFG